MISVLGELMLVPVSYNYYGKLGEYYVSMSVTWGGGSECIGVVNNDYSLVTFNGSLCNVMPDVEPPSESSESVAPMPAGL